MGRHKDNAEEITNSIDTENKEDQNQKAEESEDEIESENNEKSVTEEDTQEEKKINPEESMDHSKIIKKKRQGTWSTMRSFGSKFKKESAKSELGSENTRNNGKDRARSMILAEETSASEDEVSSPFPGITHHQAEPNLSQSSGNNNNLPVTSLTTKRVKSNLGPPSAPKSLRQLRDDLYLPGVSKHSKKKYKNLFSCVTKKSPTINELDKVKLAPLIASKHYLKLEFTSSECKLTGTEFLKDFPDNIKE